MFYQRSLPLNLSVRCARLQQLKGRLQEVDSEEKPRGGRPIFVNLKVCHAGFCKNWNLANELKTKHYYDKQITLQTSFLFVLLRFCGAVFVHGFLKHPGGTAFEEAPKRRQADF